MGHNLVKVENGTDIDYDFSTEDVNSTLRNCTNEYCESPEDYEDRILDHLYPDKYEWILIFAHFIVFIVGLVGNALVCIAVFRNTSMRTVTNYFIVNLAVADFMVILFCLVPTVLWDVTRTWFLGQALCKIVLYFQTVSVSVSVLTLTVISIERWYAICYPLKFKATTSRAKRLVLIIWIISLIVDIPELIVLETRKFPEMPYTTIYFTQCAPNWSTQMDMLYIILRVVVLYFIPLAFMSFAYYRIVKVLWSSANIPGSRRETPTLNGSNHVQCTAQLLTPILRGTSVSQMSAADYQLKSRRKAAKMLVAVVTMFAVCYLPVHVYSILGLITTLPPDDYIAYIVMISHWLCYANSAINPLIYNFMSGKFQQEFLRAFGCRSWSARRNRGRLPMIRRRTDPRFQNGQQTRGSTYSASYHYANRSECSQTPSTYVA